LTAIDWALIWTARARLYLRQGRPDLAVGEAERFTRQIEENPFVANAQYIYGYAGAAEATLAAWEAAGEKECPERQAAERACRNLEKAARIFWNGRPAARLYRGCYEWLAGRPREAHRAWAEALATARVQGVPYEEALAHYEIGRHLEDKEAGNRGLGEESKQESPNPLIPADSWGRREHLERAAEIFERLEIPYELNLVRAAQ
jgi:tetratricopeptide (TPR) repeat protein